MASTGCGYTGDSDIYGLGIRLGLYLQWFSFAGASFFRLESTDAAYTAYLAFQVALAVAAFVITFEAQDPVDQPYRAEIAILLYLFYGGSLVITGGGTSASAGSAWDPGRIKSAWNEILEHLVRIMIGGYSVWFWSTIEQESDRFSDPPDCPTYVFFFDRVSGNVLRGVGIFFAILAALHAINSLIDLRHAPGRFYTFLQDIFWSLSKEYRTEISYFLNENCSKWIQSQGYNIPDLPETFWKTLRVEDVTWTHVMLRNDYQTRRFPVPHSTRLTGDVETDKTRLRTDLEWGSKLMLKAYSRQDYGDVTVAEKPVLNELSLNIFQQLIGSTYHEDEDESETVFEFIHKVFTRKNAHNMKAKWNDPETASTLSKTVRGFMQYALPTLSQIIVIGKLLLNLIICVWTIAAVELMIVWNNINGVTAGTAGSVGQLIPLVIGLVVFIGTVTDVRTKFKKIRIEANVPFEIDDVRLDRLSSPQARNRMQTVDARWH